MKEQLNEIERLKQIKKEEGISYERLAREIGVSYRTLYRWLKGLSKPSFMGLTIIRAYIRRKNTLKEE